MADPFKKLKAYFSPGRACLEVTCGFITRTMKNLDVAYFSLTDPEVVTALIEAVKRGVKGSDGGPPRGIVDKDQHTQVESMRNAVKQLIDAGWDIRLDTESGYFHNKYVISDYKKRSPAVLTGSWNPTVRASKRNRENLVRIRVKAVIQQYHDNFEECWKANTTVRATDPPPAEKPVDPGSVS
jgi:phosphatidylserine/phosphatidylglycerophosphate/cardiolipin synthase-like enzyme